MWFLVLVCRHRYWVWSVYLLNTTIDRRQVGIVRDPQWADRRGGEANAIKSIEAQVASADPHPKGESQSGGAEHHGEPVSVSPSKG